jgi:hypothetical protein
MHVATLLRANGLKRLNGSRWRLMLLRLSRYTKSTSRCHAAESRRTTPPGPSVGQILNRRFESCNGR